MGRGYVDDFGVLALRNTLAGAAQGRDQDDFGIIYTSTLNIAAGGSYGFSTTSDDGSRIIIRDSAGNAVFNLNNDFHQGATTRSGTVKLVAGRVPTEASGGVTLETIRAKAETGVTYISVGRLTQSAPAADIGLDFNVV